jgi:polysaccharide export outer membrane protein
MRLRIFFAMAAVSALLIGPLAGCASQGAGLPPLEKASVTAGSGGTDVPGAYHLGPGDKLKMTVFGAEDLSGDFSVNDSGFVNLPLIGGVKALGLNADQFAHAVEAKLREGYMRDPKVAVAVTTYRPIYIYGEVTKPGEYPYAAGMTLMNAVALGGGYSYRAQQSYAVVTRDGHDYRAEPSSRLLPDDIVRVPERYF